MIGYKDLVKRLSKEWLKHKKIIISVDFDDTIFPYKFANKADCNTVINELKRVQDDALIIVWTASHPDRYQFIRDYCSENGLNIVAVNGAAMEGLEFGTEKKPYFNVHIDDRVCPPMITLDIITRSYKIFKDGTK